MIPYMEKAVREAKQQTNWTQPNKEFEDALRNFIERILEAQEFVSSLDDFVSKIVHAGRINSLAQTLLKLTAPGVPDTYQGSELWDLSLVDPDNRRSVDFEQRRQMLAQLLSGMSPNSILEHMGCGMPKMWIVHVALTLRRQHPEWFGDSAAYTPILAEGNRSEHLVGFVRGDSVITLVSRWSARLAGNWAASTVTLPQGAWNNRLTCELVPGGRVRLQTLFSKFPVALLVREAG